MGERRQDRGRAFGGDGVKRIQLRRSKGWRIPKNTVIVSRPSKWGNPFVVGKHGTREYCVELFVLLCAGCLIISVDEECIIAQKAFLAHAKKNPYHLRRKNLACWCPLNKPCHADVLLEMARKIILTKTAGG